MRCNNCKSEWTVSETLNGKIEKCPFCGATLKPQEDSVKEVFRWIVRNKGEAVFKQSRIINAILADLCASESKERYRIKQALAAEAGIFFYSILQQCNGALTEDNIKAFRKWIIEEKELGETLAEYVLDIFLYAIDSNVEDEATKETISDSQTLHLDNIDNNEVFQLSDSEAAYYIAKVTNQDRWTHIPDWNNLASISAGVVFMIGLQSNGTIFDYFLDEKKNKSYELENISKWENIIEISCGPFHIVGVCADGHVVASGYGNDDGECDVTDWKDVKTVVCGINRTVALCYDGSVLSTSAEEQNAFAHHIKDAENIVLDGRRTIVQTKDCIKVFGPGAWKTINWKNIKSIAAGDGCVFGLSEDGTVLVDDDFKIGKKIAQKLSSWNDIISIGCTELPPYIVGLQNDGKVRAEALEFESDGFSELNQWSGIDKLSVCWGDVIGLRKDKDSHFHD